MGIVGVATVAARDHRRGDYALGLADAARGDHGSSARDALSPSRVSPSSGDE